jgi:hypothetical protein
MEVCDLLGQAPTGGSDAHSDLGIGRYATQFDDPIQTEADIIVAIKQRRCQAVMLEKRKSGPCYIPSQTSKRYRHIEGW